MADGDNDYVFDEATGEWVPAADAKGSNGGAGDGPVEVRDAVGNPLRDGD